MEIIFYVALWLLSGFLAAWVATKVDNASTVVSYREAFWYSLGGVLSLVLVLLYTIFESDVMKKPLFKAKEPK